MLHNNNNKQHVQIYPGINPRIEINILFMKQSIAVQLIVISCEYMYAVIEKKEKAPTRQKKKVLSLQMVEKLMRMLVGQGGIGGE